MCVRARERQREKTSEGERKGKREGRGEGEGEGERDREVPSSPSTAHCTLWMLRAWQAAEGPEKGEENN